MSGEAQRPSVFEGTRIGIQSDVDIAVVPNRTLQSLSLTNTDPKEPATVVAAKGRRGAADLVRQKRHTESELSGEMAYYDDLYAALLTWGNPDAIINVGAGVWDWIWQPMIDQDPHPLAATFEEGQVGFPSRFDSAQATAATLTFGKTNNTWNSPITGRSLNETTQSFAGTPTLVPIVPLSPKDNAHYVGTAVYSLHNAELCDTENSTVTVGQKRQPHFSQCSAQPSFQSVLPVDESGQNLITLQLQHKSTSRGYLANLRNRDLLYYGTKNVGPEVVTGSGLFYEQEWISPFKFMESGGTGDVDAALARTWNLKPVFEQTFNPFNVGTAGGWYAFRIRCGLQSVPSASLL